MGTLKPQSKGPIYSNAALKWLCVCVVVVEPEMPEHNLEPPRFSRRALERILTDWTAVRAMLTTGCRDQKASRFADALRCSRSPFLTSAICC